MVATGYGREAKVPRGATARSRRKGISIINVSLNKNVVASLVASLKSYPSPSFRISFSLPGAVITGSRSHKSIISIAARIDFKLIPKLIFYHKLPNLVAPLLARRHES